MRRKEESQVYMFEECYDRENEKPLCLNALKNNKISILLAEDSKGSTTLLKYLYRELFEQKSIAFFIDLNNGNHIANQIGLQIKVFLSAKSLLNQGFRSILPQLYNLINIPVINISLGQIVTSLHEIVKINNFKIINSYDKLMNLCLKLMSKDLSKAENIYFIVDNATDNLNIYKDDLLKIASIANVKMLLLAKNNSIYSFVSIVNSINKCNAPILSLTYPSRELIEAMCEKTFDLDKSLCQNLIDQNLDIYEIYKSLSSVKNQNLGSNEEWLCNVVHNFNYVLSYNTLSTIYSRHFRTTKKNALEVIDILLNKKAVIKTTKDTFTTSICKRDTFLDVSQTTEVMSILYDIVEELTLIELKFYFEHTKVLNIKSKIALNIIKKSLDSNTEDYKNYILFVNNIDTKKDIILVLCCLYETSNFKRGHELLENHKERFDCISQYNLFQALFLERLYDKSSVDIVQSLLNNEKENNDFKCLLAILYISCLINVGDKNLIKNFFDETSNLYFLNYRNCKYYSELLNALGNYYYNDSLLIEARRLYHNDEMVLFNRALPNLIVYYDRNNEFEKCNDLIKDSIKNIVFTGESAFYFNNLAIHNLKYGVDNMDNIIQDFKMLSLINKNETAALLSSINYGVALLLGKDYDVGLAHLQSIRKDVEEHPSKPLLDNYYYDIFISYKCFKPTSKLLKEYENKITSDNRNYGLYKQFKKESSYNVATFKKYIIYCYLFERKFNVLSLLNA